MLKRNRFHVFLSLAAALLLVSLGSGCSTTPTPAAPAAEEIARSAAPEDAADAHRSKSYIPSAQPVVVPFYGPPDRIDLCGDPVPLDEADVWERFDREFTLVVYNQAQVYLWLKRMERYFPWIEERLSHYGLPEDLKYVAIVESDLLPTAVSPKGAAGPWQFMPQTGQAYGLDQRGSVDFRYDFEQSTEAAFRLLGDLYARYNDWALAIATYNCGDKRILEAMQSQGVRDFYHLRLPMETERYVFRILAVKTVLGNPENYGYHLPGGHGYQQLNLDRVQVRFSCPVPLQAVAETAGTTFRELKRLNPAFRSDHVPSGTHEVKLPSGMGKRFEAGLESLTARFCGAASAPAAAPSVEPKPRPSPIRGGKPPETRQRSPRHHVVKQGETVTGIAARYNVRPDELRRANSLSGSHITVGQRLIIP